MPINKNYNIEIFLSALRHYLKKSNANYKYVMPASSAYTIEQLVVMTPTLKYAYKVLDINDHVSSVRISASTVANKYAVWMNKWINKMNN